MSSATNLLASCKLAKAAAFAATQPQPLPGKPTRGSGQQQQRNSSPAGPSGRSPPAAAPASFWLQAGRAASRHACFLHKRARAQALMEAAMALSAASSEDLLVIGPGVLGSYLGKLWLEQHPSATLVGQTNTDANHERLHKLRFSPRTKAEAGEQRFPFVAFCAPPSGSVDYVAEVRAALALWDGTGTFVFTGSAGVYAVDDGSQCNEDSPVTAHGVNERTDRLLAAEAVVLGAGGCVVRLAGLYHAHRGAHTFFLRLGSVARWPGYTVNLLHYEDAASLVAAVLQGPGHRSNPSEPSFFRSRVFLGTDGSPLTFQEMINATVASGAFEGHVSFTGEEGASKGKLLCNARTRQALDWAPRYPSFEEFMAGGATDFYTESELF